MDVFKNVVYGITRYEKTSIAVVVSIYISVVRDMLAYHARGPPPPFLDIYAAPLNQFSKVVVSLFLWHNFQS